VIIPATIGKKAHCFGFKSWPKLTDIHRGFRSAAFGAAAGVALLFYASGIPRVQNDILKVRISGVNNPVDMDDGSHKLQKIPGAAPLFTKEVHPADNVSIDISLWRDLTQSLLLV
jgi:hypothetical protein